MTMVLRQAEGILFADAVREAAAGRWQIAREDSGRLVLQAPGQAS